MPPKKESQLFNGTPLTALSEGLKRDNETEAELVLMYDAATTILNHPSTSTETFVGGAQATVSSEYTAISFDDQQRYARLLKGGKDSITIIFPSTTNLDKIIAPMTSLIIDSSDGVTISSSTGLDVAGIEYQQLARHIIGKISHLNRDRIQQFERTSYAKDQQERENKAKRKTIIKRIGVTTVIATVLGYGHLLFNNPDAKIGPVPMPSVVEFFVDWNNASDHTAQSLPEPTNAADIHIGVPVESVPVDMQYDIREVPDSTFDGFFIGEANELSKPGLYVSNFDLSRTVDQVPKVENRENPIVGKSYDGLPTVDANGCFIIQGDYLEGKTRVFTQNPDFNTHVKIEATDLDELRVCSVEDAPSLYSGSLYIYQQP